MGGSVSEQEQPRWARWVGLQPPAEPGTDKPPASPRTSDDVLVKILEQLVAIRWYLQAWFVLTAAALVVGVLVLISGS
jgi:hypothetical protein